MYEPLVVYEDPAFLILYKPPGIHTVPLGEGEEGTLLGWCAERFPEVGRVRGKKAVEGGVLHRLDRETRGLVLAARTQEAFDCLSAQQEEGRIIKTYGALAGGGSALPGFPRRPPGFEAPPFPSCIESAFRAYGPGRRAVRPCLQGTLYRTVLKTVKAAGPGLFYVELSLVRGFRHQLRCHLAWAGLPIRGDVLYGGGGTGPLALKAQGLRLFDPLDGRPREFTLDPLYEE